MKFDKYLFLVLFAGLLFSCSKDEIENNLLTPPVEVYNYDAFLSLSVGNIEIDTKAISGPGDLSGLNTPDRIQKLCLAVFSEAGKLVAFKEVSSDANNSINQVMDVSVVSGTVKILLIANYDGIPEKWYKEKPLDSDTYGIGKTTVDDFLKNLPSTSLEKEINGYLTMSSGVLTFNLQAGYNFIGCAQTIGDVTVGGKKGVELLGQTGSDKVFVSKLKLYHNVARVQIGAIHLDPKPEYGDVTNGGYAQFVLDEVFVANVKSKSMICSEEPWGTVESPAENSEFFWWCGDYADQEGALKKGNAVQRDYLKYSFIEYEALTNSYELYNHYPFAGNYNKAIAGKVDKSSEMILDNPLKRDGQRSTVKHNGSGSIPIGMFFYVYENNQKSKESENQTLIILKGDYKYKKDKKDQEEHTIKGCYYAVPVNNQESSTIIGTVDHTYIKRNYWYTLEFNIKGPGSKQPYGKDISANMSASVKVEDWNVVNIDESVE